MDFGDFDMEMNFDMRKANHLWTAERKHIITADHLYAADRLLSAENDIAEDCVLADNSCTYLRNNCESGVYHIFARGFNGNDIFRSDDERKRFLWGLNRQLVRTDSVLYAFVIMDNHFHLLVRSKDPLHLADYSMKSYSGWMYLIKDFSGKVFGYPIGIVQKQNIAWQIDSFLYILNNPVLARMCRFAQDYYYSSYGFYKKHKSRLSQIIEVDTSFMIRNFGTVANLKSALDSKLRYQQILKEFK